jgi:exodeoxyribonuclease VII large subunit
MAQGLGRPSARLAQSHQRLQSLQAALQGSTRLVLQRQSLHQRQLNERLPLAVARGMDRRRERLARSGAALSLLDPRLVLQRGYAYLTNASGEAIVRIAQAAPGEAVQATLSDGVLPLRVREPGA